MLHLLSWATHTKIICRDKQQHSVERKHEDWINVSSKGQLTHTVLALKSTHGVMSLLHQFHSRKYIKHDNNINNLYIA